MPHRRAAEAASSDEQHGPLSNMPLMGYNHPTKLGGSSMSRCILSGLSLVALFLALGVGPALAQQAEYIGNSACKTCHSQAAKGEQWNKWKASKHATALETLKSPKAIELAKAKGITAAPSEAPECLKCHVTGYDPAKKAAPEKITMADGVQCESCHGPSSLHQADGKKLLMKDTTIDVKVNQPLPTADACTKCHNAESPSWNPEKYTTKDGKKVGFDFDQAKEKIAHPNPKNAKPAA
jgi:hypothetical protein